MNNLSEKIEETGLNKNKDCFEKLDNIELNLHKNAIENLSKSGIDIKKLQEMFRTAEINILFSDSPQEELKIIVNNYILKCSTKYDTHLFVFYAGKDNEKYQSSCIISNIFEITTGYASSKSNSDSLLKIYNYFRKNTQDIKRKEITNIEPIIPSKLHSIYTKNIILYGAPGVGKTHNYQRIISLIEENEKSEKEIFDTITNNTSSEKIELNNDTFETIKDDNRVKFVTFHQNYSYEDFIEGFRPSEDGKIKLEDGIFKNIVTNAIKEQNKNFYIVIDEINRGNISKIFGELITLIEEDKRDTYEVTLPYSKESFKIPSNLYIIATMNSTDKSIATIDIALRRRFTFLKMLPNPNLVTFKKARVLMKLLNKKIGHKNNLGEDYMLGHSYFMKVTNENELEFIKEYKIKPLLEEYFYANDEKLKEASDILDAK